MTSSALFSSATGMQSLFHSLNIGTLATWLSVAGFGTVGVVVPVWQPVAAPPAVGETRLIDEDFTLGDSGSPDTAVETPDAAASLFSLSR